MKRIFLLVIMAIGITANALFAEEKKITDEQIAVIENIVKGEIKYHTQIEKDKYPDGVFFQCRTSRPEYYLEFFVRRVDGAVICVVYNRLCFKPIVMEIVKKIQVYLNPPASVELGRNHLDKLEKKNNK